MDWSQFPWLIRRQPKWLGDPFQFSNTASNRLLRKLLLENSLLFPSRKRWMAFGRWIFHILHEYVKDQWDINQRCYQRNDAEFRWNIAQENNSKDADVRLDLRWPLQRKTGNSWRSTWNLIASFRLSPDFRVWQGFCRPVLRWIPKISHLLRLHSLYNIFLVNNMVHVILHDLRTRRDEWS